MSFDDYDEDWDDGEHEEEYGGGRYDNPNYQKKLFVDLTSVLAVAKEQDYNGGFQRQVRDTKGRFGPAIISKGKVNKDYRDAIERFIRKSLVDNYNELIGAGKSAEKTGTLLRSLREGIYDDVGDLDDYRFTFSLKPILRKRDRGQIGRGDRQPSNPDVNTQYYGSKIFKGRGSVYSSRKMVFPRYGVGGTGWVFTNKVKATEPQYITILTDGQRQEFNQSLFRPISEIIKDNLRAQSDEAT